MKIFIISDTHLGCRSNSVFWLDNIKDYFYNFFIPLVKKEYKPGDVLLHLGDVFDNRQSINLAAQHLGISIFEELSKIFDDIHIIVGNHDIFRKNSNDISSVDCLKYIPNVTVHKKCSVIEFDTVKCLLMPWRKNSEHEKETLKRYKNKNIEYLFCHTEYNGAQLTSNVNVTHESGNDINTFKSFKKVFSGHIHYRQEYNNFTFVGNPYQMTRSDRNNQKGIYILDLSTHTTTFVPNTYSPEYKRYYLNSLYNSKISDLVSEMKNSFVDIMIPTNLLGKYNINKLIDTLDGIPKTLSTKIYDDSVEDLENSHITIDNNNFNILDISNSYIDGLKHIDDNVKQQLKSSIFELYKEVTQKSYEN